MTKRLLYIDDDHTLVRLAQKAFGRAGYEVVHAPDPQTGLELIEQGDIAGIILDHYLRHETGLDFLQLLNGRGIATPVVYVTGSSEAKIAIDALKAGAADYVIKTVGDEFWPLLLNSVKQALESAEMRAAREQAEQEIRAAKERAEILLAEVNHRVANSLALVGALIRLQVSSSEEASVRNALSEIQGRISAIAGMHRSLYTADDVRNVNMDRYLSALVEELMQTIEKDGRALEIKCDIDPMAFSSERAVYVGLIVTELLTNAVKYAYPADSGGGEIRLKLKRTNADEVLLVVEDDGTGYSTDGSAQGTGLGSRIVASMAKTLGSGIRYAPLDRGTRAEIPLSLLQP